MKSDDIGEYRCIPRPQAANFQRSAEKDRIARLPGEIDYATLP
ncbi:hypothetical protein [Cohnella cholangitidis]|nr:hypothetical protein [Cohnella cholangitidis]